MAGRDAVGTGGKNRRIAAVTFAGPTGIAKMAGKTSVTTVKGPEKAAMVGESASEIVENAERIIRTAGIAGNAGVSTVEILMTAALTDPDMTGISGNIANIKEN